MKQAGKSLKLLRNARPRRRCKLVSLAILLTSSVAVSAAEMVWNKTPLILDLEVGEERMIHFPQAMAVGLPANLRSNVRVQSIGNTVYLLANRPFDRQRVLMRSKTDGTMVVFDIQGTTESVDDSNVYVRTSQTPSTENHSKKSPNYATLTRFAAQYAYAPARLVSVPKGVSQSPTPKSAKGLLRGLDVDLVPYSSWRTNTGLYLTTVKIVNKGQKPIELHPKHLRGSWLTATFHHYRLLPKGSGAETTVVYLISRYPFSQALER